RRDLERAHHDQCRRVTPALGGGMLVHEVRSTAKADAGPKGSSAPVLRRKCACGVHTTGGGEGAECRRDREPLRRGAASGHATTGAVPPIVGEVTRSAGQPLDPTTRAYMEPRFGYDFSRVRVHTDSRAAASARAVNALAYTVGDDVVFAASRYDP